VLPPDGDPSLHVGVYLTVVGLLPRSLPGLPGLRKNGHVADSLEASKLVQSFPQVLALRRRDKGKPAARRARKANGPPT
jgi:hypothetical protein